MTVEDARWAASACLLLYAVLLTIKARRKARQCNSLRMSVKALASLLKDGNEENSRLRHQHHALMVQRDEWRCFNYDLGKAPAGTLQLLTRGGTRLVEPLGSVKRAQDMGIVAWARCADIDVDEEVRLGLRSTPQ